MPALRNFQPKNIEAARNKSGLVGQTKRNSSLTKEQKQAAGTKLNKKVKLSLNKRQ